MSEDNGKEITDRTDQYGEVCVALHNVAAKKLREKAEECRLELEAFCEQKLGKIWNDSEFRRISHRLSRSDTKRTFYFPSERNCTILIFATEYFADDLLCQELLTSFAVGLMHKPELFRMAESDEQKLAALV